MYYFYLLKDLCMSVNAYHLEQTMHCISWSYLYLENGAQPVHQFATWSSTTDIPGTSIPVRGLVRSMQVKSSGLNTAWAVINHPLYCSVQLKGHTLWPGNMIINGSDWTSHIEHSIAFPSRWASGFDCWSLAMLTGFTLEIRPCVEPILEMCGVSVRQITWPLPPLSPCSEETMYPA